LFIPDDFPLTGFCPQAVQFRKNLFYNCSSIDAMVRRRMLKIIRSKERSELQWLQDPSEINGDNLNNLRREASRYFRNKRGII
jgi:hypothetical protein